jgi:hypothetical protein
MTYEERLRLARELLNSVYESVFSDESRVLSFLNASKSSPDAMIDEMANSVRHMGLSALREKLHLGSLDSGVELMVDELESQSKKKIRSLWAKFLGKEEMSISDMLRPGRKV